MKFAVLAVVLSILVGSQALAEGRQQGVASTEESLTSQEYLVYDLVYDASWCLRDMGLYEGELPVWGDDWRVQHRLGFCLGMYEAAIRYALRATPVGGSIERIVPDETGDELRATYLMLYDASVKYVACVSGNHFDCDEYPTEIGAATAMAQMADFDAKIWRILEEWHGSVLCRPIGSIPDSCDPDLSGFNSFLTTFDR